MTPEQATDFFEKNQIKLVLAQFIDIHGVAKAKAVPVSHFQDILTDGAGFAGFAVWGLGQEPHDADYMAVGDLSTLSLVPWQPGYAAHRVQWARQTKTVAVRHPLHFATAIGAIRTAWLDNVYWP